METDGGFSFLGFSASKKAIKASPPSPIRIGLPHSDFLQALIFWILSCVRSSDCLFFDFGM